MKIENLKTFEIMVPYKMGNHDGIDETKPKRKHNIPVPYHRLWDEKVKAKVGGLTICKVAQGQWVSPSGKTFRELMIPVRISCSEEQILEIIKMTAEHYEQEAIHCMCVSENTMIYHRNAAEEKTDVSKVYNSDFGDSKVCDCGHTYYRHFDSYNEMENVGCKYCECASFAIKP